MAGFSSDVKENLRKSLIHYYDFKTHTFEKPNGVCIDTQCMKKCFYELDLNDTGIYFSPNLLEKIFKNLEDHYGNFRKSIEKKLCYENFKCKSFLTESEKNFWMKWITQQFLRLPDFYNHNEYGIKNLLESFYSLEITRTKNLSEILPFAFHIFNEKWSELKKFNIAVGWDIDKMLITSDMPIYFEFDNNIIDFILFPISSNIVIFLWREDRTNERNILFKIDANMRKSIFINMCINAKRMIYFNHIFTETERQWCLQADENRTNK